MPHNLYLHSFIVQTRCFEWRNRRPQVVASGFGDEKLYTLVQNQLARKESKKEDLAVQMNENEHEKGGIDETSLRHYVVSEMRNNLHYCFVDLLVALIFAFFVNCAILVVAGANFYYGSDHVTVVSDLFDAHSLLSQYLGPAAGVVFALALLFAGQSSTLTATLAGQVVMSGFLGMSARPWIRRLVTRLVAIIPAMVAACIAGRTGLSQLLVGSQVALSIQLPFAVVPLVYFTMRKKVMRLDLVVEQSPAEKGASEAQAIDHQPSMDEAVPWVDKLTQKWSENATVRRLFGRFSSPKPKPPQPASIAESSTDVQSTCGSLQSDVVLRSLPEPVTYANGLIMNVIAVLVSLLLVGLNIYLVISLAMGQA